jgi:hypothetical protein
VELGIVIGKGCDTLGLIAPWRVAADEITPGHLECGSTSTTNASRKVRPA